MQNHTVRANALRSAGVLNHAEPLLSAAVKEGHLKFVAARYDFATGRVEVLPTQTGATPGDHAGPQN